MSARSAPLIRVKTGVSDSILYKILDHQDQDQTSARIYYEHALQTEGASDFRKDIARSLRLALSAQDLAKLGIATSIHQSQKPQLYSLDTLAKMSGKPTDPDSLIALFKQSIMQQLSTTDQAQFESLFPGLMEHYNQVRGHFLMFCFPIESMPVGIPKPIDCESWGYQIVSTDPLKLEFVNHGYINYLQHPQLGLMKINLSFCERYSLDMTTGMIETYPYSIELDGPDAIWFSEIVHHIIRDQSASDFFAELFSDSSIFYKDQQGIVNAQLLLHLMQTNLLKQIKASAPIWKIEKILDNLLFIIQDLITTGQQFSITDQIEILDTFLLLVKECTHNPFCAEYYEARFKTKLEPVLAVLEKAVIQSICHNDLAVWILPPSNRSTYTLLVEHYYHTQYGKALASKSPALRFSYQSLTEEDPSALLATLQSLALDFSQDTECLATEVHLIAFTFWNAFSQLSLSKAETFSYVLAYDKWMRMALKDLPDNTIMTSEQHENHMWSFCHLIASTPTDTLPLNQEIEKIFKSLVENFKSPDLVALLKVARTHNYTAHVILSDLIYFSDPISPDTDRASLDSLNVSRASSRTPTPPPFFQSFHNKHGKDPEHDTEALHSA